MSFNTDYREKQTTDKKKKHITGDKLSKK
ncbi:hypothetical protein F383_35835 [Gossypium arboreum]|uniref:Uncharacterized protein n=1 Tax=Gossypium arboreum TaxID=29729 RepID=A0A0B0PVS3_GOSAR|nr:hypothetical protein F383_35835 [Gossypium arboreum]